ncbi:MAG TPA: YggS family pyridoxal phosphate-dependent enzyme [Clostridia bacterium]|nr:YggS family pyridoxal phosphate-dependent enzyme [Clostridia bacterium]
MKNIAADLAGIRQRIRQAAEKVGQDPASIQLVAVTKNIEIPLIEEACARGLTDLGENRVQELVKKYEVMGDKARWHLIGHLQTNKVKYIVDKVCLVHSLDRMNLAREINKRAGSLGRKLPVLVQVNVAEEESKFGLKVTEVLPFIREVKDLEWISIQGLMTMAPFVDDPEKVRPVFRCLKELQEEIASNDFPGVEMRYLSMGMTNDFDVAIEEGANMIRIGTGIFGGRD